MNFWHDKVVVVTGGKGFLGSHVVTMLHDLRCKQVFAPGNAEYDLREKAENIRLLRGTAPDVVIHLAAVEVAKNSGGLSTLGN